MPATPVANHKKVRRREHAGRNNKIAFLYWYSYFRLIPIDPNRKHSDDPDPSFFGEELGKWEGDTLVIDSIGFKDEKVWLDDCGHVPYVEQPTALFAAVDDFLDRTDPQ